MSPSGIAVLSGRGQLSPTADIDVSNDHKRRGEGDFNTDADAGLEEAFAAVEAAMIRVDRAIARKPQHPKAPVAMRKDAGPSDPFEGETEDLGAWKALVQSCSHLPPTLAAALAIDSWDRSAPVPQMAWLGRMLAAAILRERGKSRWHLPCLFAGSKTIERDRRQSQNPNIRLLAHLDAISAAATAGLSQHDRWLTTRDLLVRKLEGRRSTSRLPELLDYVLSRPVVSTRMIADELRVSQRAAQDLVSTLGLREMTGRGRYRAWGIL